jgi:hypothetical protein
LQLNSATFAVSAKQRAFMECDRTYPFVSNQWFKSSIVLKLSSANLAVSAKQRASSGYDRSLTTIHQTLDLLKIKSV